MLLWQILIDFHLDEVIRLFICVSSTFLIFIVNFSFTNPVSQIQETLYCAQKHRIQVRVRSGLHDYEGLSFVSLEPFVILDMINLRNISIDVENNTAWVQFGATLGELYY